MTLFNALSTTRRATLLGAFALAMTGCATTSGPANLTDSLAQQPALSTFQGLVAKAGLGDTLKAAGPYTVFAPTNDAFKSVPAATMDDLAKHPEKLKAVLSYHIAMGKMMAADIKTGNAKTLEGSTVALGKAGDFVTVEAAMVVTPNLASTNGVIHTVDTVLMPPKKK
jgi:uncharacterized surface protein with fasciclin (FAS1) repeats